MRRQSSRGLAVLLALAVMVFVAACGASEPTPQTLCRSHHGIEWSREGPEQGEETVLCKDGHGYRLLPKE